MISVTARKNQLDDRLADLTARLASIDAELDTHQNADWEELATEREGDEVLESMGRDGQAEIRRIRAALARVESGDYGTCVKCGAEIAEDRLNLLPETPFCRNCAG